MDDIVDHYREFIRLGEDSEVMKCSGLESILAFNDVFVQQINAIYKSKPLRALAPQTWPGVICQPFVFGAGEVDWTGSDALRDKLISLLRERKGASVQISRITRIYDRNYVFLLKPDRLRFWMRSVALRDADETLADLRGQGL